MIFLVFLVLHLIYNLISYSNVEKFWKCLCVLDKSDVVTDFIEEWFLVICFSLFPYKFLTVRTNNESFVHTSIHLEEN